MKKYFCLAFCSEYLLGEIETVSIKKGEHKNGVLGYCWSNSCCNNSCCYNFKFWVMKNIVIFFTATLIYMLNQLLLKKIDIIFLSAFFNFYLNDVLAQILILSYSNILLKIVNKSVSKLIHIFVFVLACGFVWEFITPLYKYKSTFDWFDFLAYLAGGLIYYLTISALRHKNYRQPSEP